MALSNGDLACGCSDHNIWVFTRDQQRLADGDTVRIYEERLQASKYDLFRQLENCY